MSYSVKTIRKQFAEQGVFYTDEKLAKMLAEEVKRYGEVTDVYDPTCGAGNLLAVFADEVEKYGQEINPEQAEVARQRLANSHIVTGDTLVSPAFTERKFKHIVANYPFSIKWQPAEDARWSEVPELPPPSKADYAFILHIISMLDNDGVAAVLGFPGILYRGQREGKIREWITRKNLIESVTTIEKGYFEDTNIETALILFRKNKKTTDIKFAIHEKGIERVVSLEDVEHENFCLTPSRYIQIIQEKKEPDLNALEMTARSGIIRKLEKQLLFSAQAIELHTMLGLPPLPPLANFITDIKTVLSKFE